MANDWTDERKGIEQAKGKAFVHVILNVIRDGMK